MTALLLIAALLDPLGAAVATEPDRPGLRLAWAHQLLRAGDLNGAEREARRVLVAWPEAFRPQMVLAGVAFARGEIGVAKTALQRVAARAPEPLARIARATLERLERSPGGWTMRAVMGVAYDSRAEPPDLGTEADFGNPAARLRLGAGATYRRASGPWRWRADGTVDRTAHLGAAEDRDRLLAVIDGRGVRDLGPALVGVRLEGRGALGGRVGSPHHAGGGLGAWLSRDPGAFTPWLEARGLYLRFADRLDPDVLVGDVGLGAGTHHRRWRGGLRLGAVHVANAAGWTELGGDVTADLLLGRITLSGQAGLGTRDQFDSLRPRAAAIARLQLGASWTLLGDLRWRSAPGWDRMVTGLTLEVTR